MQLAESELMQITKALKALNVHGEMDVRFVGSVEIWQMGELLGSLDSVSDDDDGEVFWYYKPVQKDLNFASGEVS